MERARSLSSRVSEALALIATMAILAACSNPRPAEWAAPEPAHSDCTDVTGIYSDAGDFARTSPSRVASRAAVSFFTVLTYGVPAPNNRLGMPEEGASASGSSYRQFQIEPATFGNLQAMRIHFVNTKGSKDFVIQVRRSDASEAPCGMFGLRMDLPPRRVQGLPGVVGQQLKTTLYAGKSADGTLIVLAKSRGYGLFLGFQPHFISETYWLRFPRIKSGSEEGQ